MINGCCCKLRQTTTKVNVNTDKTDEGGKEGIDIQFQVYMLAVVGAKHIVIRPELECLGLSLLGTT